MVENKMKEVAKLLGLELEEEFRIKNSNYRYKLSKEGFMFWSDFNQDWFYTSKLEQLLIGYCEIIKLPKPILDKKEKEYLSNVIKPFRDRVIVIVKGTIQGYNGKEFISFLVQSPELCKEYFSLPMFDIGTMYKGMKSDKKYTLEELGL